MTQLCPRCTVLHCVAVLASCRIAVRAVDNRFHNNNNTAAVVRCWCWLCSAPRGGQFNTKPSFRDSRSSSSSSGSTAAVARLRRRAAAGFRGPTPGTTTLGSRTHCNGRPPPRPEQQLSAVPAPRMRTPTKTLESRVDI